MFIFLHCQQIIIHELEFISFKNKLNSFTSISHDNKYYEYFTSSYIFKYI